MRRYWVSIVLSVFVIVGLGTYYVYGAMVQFPEYKISKVSGDVNEGNKIIVQGAFLVRGRYQYLNATTEGRDYPSRRNIFSQIFSGTESWRNEQADIHQIFKDHRSFMRGKGNINNFYQDDEWIIYADAVVNNTSALKSEIVLSIDSINQTTGAVEHYETILDDSSDYSYIYVEDVQMIGEQVHMLINQRSKGNLNGSAVEYHDYVVDVNSGALMNNGRVAFGDNPKNNIKQFDRSISNTIYSSPSEYSLLVVTDEQTRANDYMGKFDQHLYSYSYKTGELKDLSDLLMKEGIDDNGDVRLDSNVLSILNYQTDFISISRYNIDTGTLTNEVLSLTAQQLGVDKIISGNMKNNKLYILSQSNFIPQIAVLDATNGAILYTGKIVYDGIPMESKWEGTMYMQIAD